MTLNNPYTVEIKKGDHHGSPSLRRPTYNSEGFSINVLFGNDWRYHTKDPNNQGDVCKIAGMVSLPFWKLLVACISPAGIGLLVREHHKNSVRIGVSYNPEEDNLNLYAYRYIDGVRHTTKLTQLDFYVGYTITVEYLSETHARFSITNNLSGKTLTTSLPSPSSKWMFTLNPYFGGDETAPHNMKLDLTWKKI